MVSTVRTFFEELVAKLKGKASSPDSESSPPNHVMNLSLVKIQCADMFSAACNFVAVLIDKIKSKVSLKAVLDNISRAPFLVSFPRKKVFPKLVMKRSKKGDQPKDGDKKSQD